MTAFRLVLAGAVALAACAAHAQAPQLPPPESVLLDRLGYMSTSRRPAKVVDQSNRTNYPQMRWALQHTRELLPTRNIRRGHVAVAPLPRLATRIWTATRSQDDKGQRHHRCRVAEQTYTDAIVVLHRGRVVYERYMNQMRPETPHLLFSMTKSFTGLLAAQLAHEGLIDPQALVTKYVPELAGSAWGDMKVRDVMDMTGAVRYREVYTDPTTEVFPYLYASRCCRRRPATRARRHLRAFSRR